MSKKKDTWDVVLCKKVVSLVKVWSSRLMLSQWDFTIKTIDAPISENIMCIDWSPNYKTAVLTVNSSAPDRELNYSPEAIERSVVHELCHAVLAPVVDVYSDELKDGGVLYTLFHRGEEATVENLASIMLEAYSGSPK